MKITSRDYFALDWTSLFRAYRGEHLLSKKSPDLSNLTIGFRRDRTPMTPLENWSLRSVSLNVTQVIHITFDKLREVHDL